MEKLIGKVTNVFIPNEYKNNELIDVMNSNKIGFIVVTENGVIEIIQEQDEFNSKILRDDLVIITKQNISEKEFTDIELYDGDEYE
ncbi:MAG: hypothetical protein IJO32_05895 [Bacilli bacterium]|nr:hypothetical protein [Bacilli bacterium]